MTTLTPVLETLLVNPFMALSLFLELARLLVSQADTPRIVSSENTVMTPSTTPSSVKSLPWPLSIHVS